MVSSVNDAKCKKCNRKPSYMGFEPMYLIERDYKHIILCGECFTKLLHKIKIETQLDYSNLFTYIYPEQYENILREFLSIPY